MQELLLSLRLPRLVLRPSLSAATYQFIPIDRGTPPGNGTNLCAALSPQVSPLFLLCHSTLLSSPLLFVLLLLLLSVLIR